MTVFRVLALLLVSLGLGCSTSSRLPSPDSVLARVGGQAITGAEFDAALRQEAAKFDGALVRSAAGAERLKRHTLDQLVQEYQQAQRATQAGVVLTAAEWDAALATRRGRLSPEAWLENLRKSGIDPALWEARQRRRLLIRKGEEARLGPQIAVDPREVENYYRRNRASFREPDQVRCRHIAVSSLAKAEKIAALLAQGENFAALAKQYSESPEREKGGDLGFIARGQYPETFEKACFSLNTGQTSPVLPSEYGYHVFRVIEKRPGRTRTLNEVRAELETRLREEKRPEPVKTTDENQNKDIPVEVDAARLADWPVPLQPGVEGGGGR